MINVAKNAHVEFELAKKFGHRTGPQTHEAIIREINIQDMWIELRAPENNTHPERHKQKANEMLDRLLGITNNFRNRIESLQNGEGDESKHYLELIQETID